MLELGPGPDTIEDAHHVDEMPVTPIGRKYNLSDRLSDQKIDSYLTGDTDLLTLFVSSTQTLPSFAWIDPGIAHAKHFQASESRLAASSGRPCWVLALLLHGCHRRTQ